MKLNAIACVTAAARVARRVGLYDRIAGEQLPSASSRAWSGV
jgi:hypothetical protein